jgi:DNA-binding PadR family transcriptional regulator
MSHLSSVDCIKRVTARIVRLTIALMAWMGEIVPGSDLTGMTVLALLVEQPHHPYEMGRLIRQRRKDHAAGSPRTLYRAVERLAREGLVEPLETSREGNRPERTTYRITPEGIERFHDDLEELLAQPGSDIPAFTAAIGFLAHLAPDTAGRALQTRAVMLSGQIAELAAQHAGLLAHLHRVLLVELEYLLAVRRAELDIVEQLVADITSGALTWKPDALPVDPSGAPS